MVGGAADTETPDASELPLAGVRVAVLGCGAVGSVLARELTSAGAELALWSRDPARAETVAAGLAREARCLERAPDALEGAELALFCVTDAALAGFVDACAETAPHPAPGASAVHTNGWHGLDVLEPLREAGWETGKLHPLASLPPGEGNGPGAVLRGAWFATLATEGARPWLERLLGALAGRELALPPGRGEEASRALHAAAALVSGGATALLDAGCEAAAAAGLDPEDAGAALAGLLAGTAANLVAGGPKAALTGPAARGASEVVAGHLEALGGAGADAAELYRRLARRMVHLAAERGSIDGAARAELERLLNPSDSSH